MKIGSCTAGFASLSLACVMLVAVMICASAAVLPNPGNVQNGFKPIDVRAPGFTVVEAGTSKDQSASTTNPPFPAAAALKRAEISGRYSLEREEGKDAGCLLILDQQRVHGGDKASLAPGCRDQGIMIFDPVGWRLIDGRLVLTARRGHMAHFDRQPDGTWRKDSREGRPLTLKKI